MKLLTSNKCDGANSSRGGVNYLSQAFMSCQLTPTTLRWSTLSPVNRKEGNPIERIVSFFHFPSLPLAVERVVERSDDRVS